MRDALKFEITNKSIMKFVGPSIILMMFASLYVMVDGIFIANFVGPIGLSGLNIVMPLIHTFAAIGIMFGTGGGAICAYQIGQGNYRIARLNFSSIFAFSIIFSVMLILPSIYYIDNIIYMLGADAEIFQFSKDYLFIALIFIPTFITQLLTQLFLFTAGKPVHAFKLTLIGGLSNIILDYVFIVIFDMGLIGAAIATGLGQTFATMYGIGCFIFLKRLSLRFVKPKFLPVMIAKASLNGSSEMVISIAGSIIVFLFNKNMMELIGINGVAAITIILYTEFLLISVYIGYSQGVAPLFSFNYGEDNIEKIKTLFKKSIIFISGVSICSFILALTCADYMVMGFESRGSQVFNLASAGLRYFSISFAFIGFNMFTSALFTAFSNGKISAFISFLRSFVFITGFLIILPKYFGIDGVWLAVPIAEVIAFMISVFLLIKYKSIYKY